jgi:hypothetical protein
MPRPKQKWIERAAALGVLGVVLLALRVFNAWVAALLWVDLVFVCWLMREYGYIGIRPRRNDRRRLL